MIGIGISLTRQITRIVAILTNLFVDEIGDHLVDENGNRLGET